MARTTKPLEPAPAPATTENGSAGASARKPRGSNGLNDLDLNKWREYADIVTDSLWQIPERDRGGVHMADYHGNFVPQIPYQAMQRYTKRGDVVLDAFLGSGTTLIECRRLGRHGIGVELKPDLARQTESRIVAEENPFDAQTTVLTGNSANTAKTAPLIARALGQMNRDKAQLVLLHPPYHSIIRFSGRRDDLSNCPDVETFNRKFGQVVDTVTPFLETGRYLTLVIGDMYEGGEWIPLGFHCMQEVMQRGYSLKSIVVKDMQGNRAKRNMENIWRYRALAGGFFIFKHEYVMFFRKQGEGKK
ncbi:MAG: DNA methyltransferase [Blastocatellia bacterium]